MGSELDRAQRLVRERQAVKAKIESTPAFLVGRTGGALHHFQPGSLTPDPFVHEIERELSR